MFSIDQNCHSLWDVVPKLQALAHRGLSVRHFIEDIDVAFTSLGSDSAAAPLRLVRERFHPSGGADWGAALFYSEFLGRLPVEIRQWEIQTGLSTSALAHRLGCRIDALYEAYSPSDNWQLIGPSYVGDRDHHRIVGDLTLAETAEFLRQILQKARENCLRSFPQADAQQGLREWFDAESQRLEGLLTQHRNGRLVDLYDGWTAAYLKPSITLERTSKLFSTTGPPAGLALLEVFLQDYDQATGLYNEALAETDLGLRPLKTSDGELPFFATLEHQGHHVRTAVFVDGSELRFGRRSVPLEHHRRLPLEKLRAAGVRCLAGKAILLVSQVRMGEKGNTLAIPHQGSLYMPAAHRLTQKFQDAGLLPGPLQPVLRIRFRLLDRMKDLDTVIRLPEHLHGFFGRSELPARQFGQAYAELSRQAAERLETFKDPAARSVWQQETFAETHRQIAQIDTRRRQLAKIDPKSKEIRELSQRQKQREVRMLTGLLDQIAADTQMAQIDTWDSRGALLPWCIALGGQKFYRHVIAQAEIYTESPENRET